MLAELKKKYKNMNNDPLFDNMYWDGFNWVSRKDQMNIKDE